MGKYGLPKYAGKTMSSYFLYRKKVWNDFPKRTLGKGDSSTVVCNIADVGYFEPRKILFFKDTWVFNSRFVAMYFLNIIHKMTDISYLTYKREGFVQIDFSLPPGEVTLLEGQTTDKRTNVYG